MRVGATSLGRIWGDAERLGPGFRWMQRSEITGGFVDEAIGFTPAFFNMPRKPVLILDVRFVDCANIVPTRTREPQSAERERKRG